jgi:hypothetical protein
MLLEINPHAATLQKPVGDGRRYSGYRVIIVLNTSEPGKKLNLKHIQEYCYFSLAEPVSFSKIVQPVQLLIMDRIRYYKSSKIINRNHKAERGA